MRQFDAKQKNIKRPILGLVTHNQFTLSKAGYVLASLKKPFIKFGFEGLIVGDNPCGNNDSLEYVYASKDDIDTLNDGDCVFIDKNGRVTVVWEKKSSTNSLLVTEMCDCNCLMCPQPPKKHNNELVEISNKILNLITLEKNQAICITGGEPTLLKDDFFDLLNLIKNKYSEADVFLLTNGKSFSDFEFTKKFVSSRPKKFMTCVSLHADVDDIHDYIAGVRGGFYKTLMGVYNLAKFREKIEIRVVINKANAERLESIALFIYRNLPFISHCAFMGLEITGYAADNYSDVWIDPYAYKDQLSRAIKLLSRADINVSIYNIPHCLIEKSYWSFAKKSISEWKNTYLLCCDDCQEKEECCGVFTTAGLSQSPNISPINDE